MIALVAIAVFVAVRDARDRVIPNRLSGALAALGVALQAGRLLAPAPPPEALARLPAARLAAALPPPATCLAAALALLALLVSAELACRRARGRPGMGLGDAKYVSAWACVVGPWAVAVLAVACWLGLAVALARGERDFALGPWLSLAGVAACCLLALA